MTMTILSLTGRIETGVDMDMISDRESSVLIIFLLSLTCYIFFVDKTYAHVSSETTTTVHTTKNILYILTGVGIADNAPDLCEPSLCYGHAYIQTMLFYASNAARYGSSHEKFFDVSNFCNNQFSADYCYGSIMAAAQLFPRDGNQTRIAEEIWDLGYTHEWMGTYNGTKQVFFPCHINETICNIYLQGEMQGYNDNTELKSGHPSYINLLGRVCLGTEQFCLWIYQNHWWYDNLHVKSYYKMLRHIQMERIMAISALSHTPVDKALINQVLQQTKPPPPPSPPPPSPDELDMEHKCDNGNDTTCYNLGLKSGFVDARIDKSNNQTRGLCNADAQQHSPNYCYGNLLGYDKGFGRQINNSAIWKAGNDTGADVGGAQGASPDPPIACTVSALFCNAYNRAYHLAYHYNIPYWAGKTAGMNFADHLIDICHEEDHPKIPGHHTSLYKSGWLDGYEDATGAASNDDGTYGAKGCKKYY